MSYSAQVVADSVNSAGIRLTTLQLRYPRFIHAEVMTHRVFSRNASSSRAIPVSKMVKSIKEDPAMPIHWGKNQPGMQAFEEHDAPVTIPEHLWQSAKNFLVEQGYDPGSAMALTEPPIRFRRELAWRFATWLAADMSQAFADAGYHKQISNRLAEPGQFISVVVTATDWDNFFELRDHEDAQPEIRALALAMKKAMAESTPVDRSSDVLLSCSERVWHLPYVLPEERAQYAEQADLLVKLSTARCARVSYLTHDGQTPSIEKDIELHDRLVAARPIHASPAEHPALCATRSDAEVRFKNFRGWIQYRYEVEYMAGCSRTPD